MEIVHLAGTGLVGGLLAHGLHRMATRTLGLNVSTRDVAVTLMALFAVLIIGGAAADVTRSGPILAIGLGSFFALKALGAHLF